MPLAQWYRTVLPRPLTIDMADGVVCAEVPLAFVEGGP